MTEKLSTASDPEIVYVAEKRVACDGAGGALGHPRVWYALDDGEAECGYCDRKFIYDPEKASAPGAKVETGFARKGALE
ncbi:MAG TPA: zinc-finger domain-containing protein [Parvularculaceae bacterium]|nr:zinc-finger domain-containing protein [Parvularculaceae bacterium]